MNWQPGNDVIHANEGADIITTGSGDDLVFAGSVTILSIPVEEF